MIKPYLCPVCGKLHQDKTELVNSSMPLDLEHSSFRGLAICTEDQKLFCNGFIAINSIPEDEFDQFNITEGKEFSLFMRKAKANGDLLYMKKSLIEKLIEEAIPPGEFILVCDRETVKNLLEEERKFYKHIH